MIWYTCIEDLGDGSNCVRNFKTKESAEEWSKERSDFKEWDCYPYGPLETTDTGSKYFWDDMK